MCLCVLTDTKSLVSFVKKKRKKRTTTEKQRKKRGEIIKGNKMKKTEWEM